MHQSVSGLDQWNRIVDQVWQSGGVNVDRYQYGYNAVGNRLWKENVVVHNRPSAAAADELFAYDGLNRLTSTTVGQLNAARTINLPTILTAHLRTIRPSGPSTAWVTPRALSKGACRAGRRISSRPAPPTRPIKLRISPPSKAKCGRRRPYL